MWNWFLRRQRTARARVGDTRTVLARAAVLLIVASVQTGPVFSQNDPLPGFRTAVDLVSLNVTVTDTHGGYVKDLDANDFSVFEDGIQQSVSLFMRESTPIALTILLDTSGSMSETLKAAQSAAIEFVRRLRPEDSAEIIGFDRSIHVLQGFTSDTPSLEQAIRKTTARGMTSLYSAIYLALKDLDHLRGAGDAERRRAMIVLSDGDDTASLLQYEDVLEAAKRSGSTIYTIIPPDPFPGASERNFNRGGFVMRQLAQTTGGRTFAPAEMSELDGVYAQISSELSHQYVLGYISNNRMADGHWRRLFVRVNRPNAVTRSRAGYFGPASSH
jgi:Ca-activated chloride channel family protein